MPDAKELFDSLFKFKTNEAVRHKGDTKGSISSTDMGLLIVHRLIVEDVNEKGECVYECLYHCRIIQFSQSGSIQQFKERELMSLEEFRIAQAEEEEQRREMMEERDKIKAEIYKSFGVTRKSIVKLKGNPESYEPTGFKGENHIYELSLRQVGGFGKSIYIKSKDEIESVE